MVGVLPLGMIRVIHLLLYVSLLSSPLWGEEPSITTNVNLVGTSTLRYYFWDIYNVKLYAPNGVLAPDSPLALRLTYFRDLEGSKIAEKSIQEMEIIGCQNNIKSAEWLSRMKSIFPDVANGVSLTGVKTKEGSSKFYKNEQFIGEIGDPQFSKCFFDIWLGPNTSEPNLRTDLLGLTRDTKLND